MRRTNLSLRSGVFKLEKKMEESILFTKDGRGNLKYI